LLLFVVYQSPYEEYITNNSDGSSFAAQLYDIVVVRKCRPTLNRELKDKEHALVSNIRFLIFDTDYLFDLDYS